MSLVVDKLLDREDNQAMRTFKNLTPREVEAYRMLSPVVNSYFKAARRTARKPTSVLDRIKRFFQAQGGK